MTSFFNVSIAHCGRQSPPELTGRESGQPQPPPPNSDGSLGDAKIVCLEIVSDQ